MPLSSAVRVSASVLIRKLSSTSGKQECFERMLNVDMPLELDVGNVVVRQLPMRGASAVAVIRDALLVVDDDHGIFRVSARGATLWAGRALHDSLGDLEGLAVNEKHTRLWALAEVEGTVLTMSLRETRPRVKAIGRLPRPGSDKNKGFEGLAFMPARFAPSGRPSLVAVHEGKPRRVAIFELPRLVPTLEMKLPQKAKRLLDDLSDVTVDPTTGTLLLLSDESRRIAVASIVSDELVLSSSYELPLGRREKPEGIDFASPSRLMVVTDDSAKLLEIPVLRTPASV